MFFSRHKTKMIMPNKALPGREQPAFTASGEARRARHAPQAALPRGS